MLRGEVADSLTIEPEAAYDLVEQHYSTLLELLSAPMPSQQVIHRLGDETSLARLEKYGVVQRDGDWIRAGARAYRLRRQEGTMSFLERFILPALEAGAEGKGIATLRCIPLVLTENEIRDLRPGPIEQHIQLCANASEQPVLGATGKFSVLWFGTSRIHDVLASEEAPYDEALQRLKLACLQRASRNESHLAVISQFDCLADSARHTALLDSIDWFVERLAPLAKTPERSATFYLTIASHWHNPELLTAQETATA